MKNELYEDWFKKNKAPCIDTLSGKVLKFQKQPLSIEMEFEALEEFTHSNGQVVQGGFVTGMLDASMAHLLLIHFQGKYYPSTLDINVSFISPTRVGKLVAQAEPIKLGKSIAFLSSKLHQNGSIVATSTCTVKLLPAL